MLAALQARVPQEARESQLLLEPQYDGAVAVLARRLSWCGAVLLELQYAGPDRTWFRRTFEKVIFVLESKTKAIRKAAGGEGDGLASV